MKDYEHPNDGNDPEFWEAIDEMKQSDHPIEDHAEGVQFEDMFISAADIEIKPVEWLVQGYIEAHTINWMIGDTEAFKTFICLDMACCVAHGMPWLDEQEVQQGPVLFVCGEGSQGIGRRVAAWAKHNGRPVPDNLYISRTSTDLADEQVVRRLGSVIEQMPVQPKMIVVDTYARNQSGAENENKDIGQFYAMTERYLVKPFGCSLLVVHHPGKDVSKGARGGASIKQNSDAMYIVERSDNKDDRITTMHCDKMKDGEYPPDTMFEAAVVSLGIFEESGKESTSLAIDYLPECDAERIRREDATNAVQHKQQELMRLAGAIRDEPECVQAHYASLLGISQATMSRYIAELRKEGHLDAKTTRHKLSRKGRLFCAGIPSKKGE